MAWNVWFADSLSVGWPRDAARACATQNDRENGGREDRGREDTGGRGTV